MNYKFPEIKAAVQQLSQLPADDLKAQTKIFKQLVAQLKTVPKEAKPAFGQEFNQLKQQYAGLVAPTDPQTTDGQLLDVTAPLAVGQSQLPELLSADLGSRHPVMVAQDEILAIFRQMGFQTFESLQLDSEYYMFDSLNFPANHPARDEYDTFIIDGQDKQARQLVAPAHTSTMQNRILRQHADSLKQGQPIAAVIGGRVFRTEDVDTSHDHTFYQIEAIYVDRQVTAAHLITTLKEFVQAYYQRPVKIKIQPFYFPFTEPSFEFAFSCPFCQQQGCRVCSGGGWIEILGCGLIHPNVLAEAGIDPKEYTGFACGIGFMRLVMTKYGIEDIRHFGSGKLEFLRQFK